LPGTELGYPAWLDKQSELYRLDGGDRLEGRWELALNQVVQAGGLEAHIHAIQNVRSKKSRSLLSIPVRFIHTNRVSRSDKLIVGFDAFVLSKALGQKVNLAKIIHGEQWSTIEVDTSRLVGNVGKVVDKISGLLTSAAPPDLVLNRHCPECEFREHCRKQAIDKNDLSLLSAMTEKERSRLKKKGILTVSQLSYTFRPRRRAKRFANRAEKYHHSLKALAIREAKTHIIGDPQLRIDGTPVFLDVEGIPDKDFFYLIGIRLENEKTVVRHHLWADDMTEEKKIWRDFLGILSGIEKPVLLHYGSFEMTFLKKMCARYGGPPADSVEATAIGSSVNLLSIVFAQVYFPTYSNGLKEIARFLGFEWTDPLATGLQSIVWRHQWEQSHNPSIREKLIVYNQDDCEALSVVAHSIRVFGEQAIRESAGLKTDVVHVESLRNNLGSKWRRFESALPDLVQINAAAHWNYQRDRLFVRSGTAKRTAQRKPRVRFVRSQELTIVLRVPEWCAECGAAWRKKRQLSSITVKDLVFGRDSVKGRLVKYLFHAYHCPSCRYDFGLHQWYQRGHARKWGWNILAYFVYNAVGLYIPQRTVHRGLERLFGLSVNRSNLNYLKTKAAEFYGFAKARILTRIIQGDLINADETQANVKGHLAYVWVLTSRHDVVYILAESREGEFVQNLLKDFKGVLVSDFYAVYDAINCRQQKCLIHLMRDLNDEILNNPFDEEMKSIVVRFAGVLKPIVETIDRYGLRKHFLRKHRADVDGFYRFLDATEFKSEAASKCKQRFAKNRDKLFTFLQGDGIPWHNNNAEHAIKAFSKLRQVISGTSTKKGVEEYLTLLSVSETCLYRGIDFLDFLESGERDVAAFARRRRKSKQR
jgi:predicted RecB family nuclease